MDWLLAIRTLLALAFVIGLIGAAGYLLRRFGSGVVTKRTSAEARLRIVEQLYLTPKNRLALIALDNQQLIVSITPQGTSLLCKSSDMSHNITDAGECSVTGKNNRRPADSDDVSDAN